MKRNQRLRHGAPRYIIGLVTSTGSMLATVALLACFAVVVMPSLFTVAPNRRAGLPSPSDSAPQAAVSAPVEMPQPPAVSPLVETPLPAAVSAEADGRESLPGMIEPPTGDIRVQTRNVAVADSEGTRENKLLTDDAVNMSFVGIWAADARACSALDRSGFLLTVIDTDGARAGETLCAFESKRQTKLGWDVVARCSNSHERWTANVSLSVKVNHLSWKSQRDTETYLRCQREEMMAQAQ